MEGAINKSKLSRSHEDQDDVLSDIRYICGSSSVITDALQKGYDVVQLPNGDVMVTEIKIVNVQYSWDKEKQKMVKISQVTSPY